MDKFVKQNIESILSNEQIESGFVSKKYIFDIFIKLMSRRYGVQSEGI